MTRVSGRANAVDYVVRTVQSARRNMNDRKKKVPEDSAETQELEQSSDIGNEDDTKRLRTLTVQELERLLKDQKPGS